MEMPIELYQALHAQLHQAGVSSDLLSRGNNETPDGEMGLRLKGRAVDIVQVGLEVPVPPEVERIIADVDDAFPTGRGRKPSSGIDERMFNFFLKGNLTRSPAEIDTSLKGKKKGIISRKLVDVSWSGGLSNDLTPNRALKDQLLTSVIDNLTIQAVPRDNCVKIAHFHKVRYTRRGDKLSYEELPSMKKINTIEMIAQHIRPRCIG